LLLKRVRIKVNAISTINIIIRVIVIILRRRREGKVRRRGS
jgi:hypothetical protein